MPVICERPENEKWGWRPPPFDCSFDLLAQLSFEFLYQLGNHLVLIADNAEGGHFEYRSVRVLVDSYYAIGCPHPCEVLDGAGDAARYIYLRLHGLPRLADLVLVRYPV